jgi:hypothetical protein
MARTQNAIATEIFKGFAAAKNGNAQGLRNIRSIKDNGNGTATVKYYDTGAGVVTKTLTIS